MGITVVDQKKVNDLFRIMAANPDTVSAELFEKFSQIRRKVNAKFLPEEPLGPPVSEPKKSFLEKEFKLPPVLGVTPPTGEETITVGETLQSAAKMIEPALNILNIPAEILKRSILSIKKGDIDFKETVVKPFLLPFIKGSIFGEFTSEGETPEDTATFNVLEQIGVGEGPSIPAPDFMKKIGVEKFTARGLAEFGLEVAADVFAFGNIGKILNKVKNVGVGGLTDVERGALRKFGKEFEELTGDELKQAAEKFKQAFGQDIEDISTDLVELKNTTSLTRQDDLVESISKTLQDNKKLILPNNRGILNPDKPVTGGTGREVKLLSASKINGEDVVSFGRIKKPKLTFVEEEEVELIRKLIANKKALPPPRLSDELSIELSKKVKFLGFDNVLDLEAKKIANRVINYFQITSPRLLSKIKNIIFIHDRLYSKRMAEMYPFNPRLGNSLGIHDGQNKLLIIKTPSEFDPILAKQIITGEGRSLLPPLGTRKLENYLVRVMSHELGHAFDNRFGRISVKTKTEREALAEKFEIAGERKFEESGFVASLPTEPSQVKFSSLSETEQESANNLVSMTSGFVGRDEAANIVRGIDVEENIVKSVDKNITNIKEHNSTRDAAFDEAVNAVQEQIGIKVDRSKIPYSIDAKSLDVPDVPLLTKGASKPNAIKDPKEFSKATGFGADNKIFTKKKRDAANENMTKNLNNLNIGINPADFKNLVNIGGFYVEGGLRDFGKWSRKMVDELGKYVRPHLKRIWKELKDNHPSAFKNIAGVTAQEKLASNKMNKLFDVPKEPFTDKLKRGSLMFQEQLDNRFVVVHEMERIVENSLGIKLPFDRRVSKQIALAQGRYAAAEPSLRALEVIQREIPKGLERDFASFMIAERVNELVGRGFKKVIKDIGLTQEDATNILSRLQRNMSSEEFGKFKKLSENYRDLLREDGLDVLLQEGIISQKLYDNVIKLNKKYMPFHVLNSFADGNYLSRVFGKGAFNVSSQDIIKPITGGVKGIDPDPFRRGEKILHRVYDIIARNRVSRMVGKLADTKGFETFVIRPKGDKVKIPEGFKELFWLDNGNKQRVFVDEAVHSKLMLFQEDQFSRGQRILAKLAGASLLRAGATQANLAFAFRNVLRDPQNAAILARHGLSGHAYVKAIAESFNRGDLYSLWERAGGGFATASSQLKREFIELGTVSRFDKAKGFLGSIEVAGEKILRGIQVSEDITRLNIFKTDLEKELGKEGLEQLSELIKGKRGKFFDLPKDVQNKIYNAAWESRDYLDFARAGSFIKHFNMFVPYMNADAQGKSKLIRFALSNPKKFALRIGIGSLAPLSVYAWNKSFESFERVPPWVRDNYIVVMYGQYLDSNGKQHPLYFRPPKGDVLKILVNPIENFLDFATQEDGDFLQTLRETFGDLWEDLVPRYITSPGSISPPTLRSMAEWQFNYSYFKNQRVAQETIGNFPISARNQFYDYTTETSKMIGRNFDLSPAKIDNLVQGMTGGLGKAILDGIDVGLFLTGATEERPNVLDKNGGFITKVPFLSQFFVDYTIPEDHIDRKLLEEASTRAGDRTVEEFRFASRIFEQIKENKNFTETILEIEKDKATPEIIEKVKKIISNNAKGIGIFETMLQFLPAKDKAWFLFHKLNEIEDTEMQARYIANLSLAVPSIISREVQQELLLLMPPVEKP